MKNTQRKLRSNKNTMLTEPFVPDINEQSHANEIQSKLPTRRTNHNLKTIKRNMFNIPMSTSSRNRSTHTNTTSGIPCDNNQTKSLYQNIRISSTNNNNHDHDDDNEDDDLKQVTLDDSILNETPGYNELLHPATLDPNHNYHGNQIITLPDLDLAQLPTAPDQLALADFRANDLESEPNPMIIEHRMKQLQSKSVQIQSIVASKDESTQIIPRRSVRIIQQEILSILHQYFPQDVEFCLNSKNINYIEIYFSEYHILY